MIAKISFICDKIKLLRYMQIIMLMINCNYATFFKLHFDISKLSIQVQINLMISSLHPVGLIAYASRKYYFQ